MAANVWLCVEALVFLVRVPVLAEALRSLRESADFIAMILIGAGYTAFPSAISRTSAPMAQKRSEPSWARARSSLPPPVNRFAGNLRRAQAGMA